MAVESKTPQSSEEGCGVLPRHDTLKVRKTASVEWCPRRDSNPHTLRHMDLNHARLPIPPRGHCCCKPHRRWRRLLLSYWSLVFCARLTFVTRRLNRQPICCIFLPLWPGAAAKDRNYSGTN